MILFNYMRLNEKLVVTGCTDLGSAKVYLTLLVVQCQFLGV
jgi:hypothetical protein